MNKQLLDSLLLQIDVFPKSKEDVRMKEFVRLEEEKLQNILNKELELFCGVSSKEIKRISQFSSELDNTVKDLLKKVDLEKSLEEIKNIENQIEKEITGDAYLFARQIIMSVKALYHHKKKNWKKAFAITLECNSLNDYLVQKGVHTLSLRVFEQNRNICSIFLKEEKYKSAYSLLFNLLNYVLNGTSENLYGYSFYKSNTWKQTESLREGYLLNLFIIQLKDSVRFNFYNKEDFLPTDWYLNLKFDTNNPNRKILSDWIYINKSLRENNYVKYFSALTNFLNQTIGSRYDILKVALIMDLIKVLEKFDYSSKEVLLDKISSYLNNKLQGNDRMREIMIRKINKKIAVVA